MDADYSRRQRADQWPRRGRWNPADLPAWYRELLGDVAASLTAWRDEDRDPHRLDPRCDPRGPQHGVERRAVR
jgi:hypothetical protein